MTPEKRAYNFIFNKRFYSKKTPVGMALVRALATEFEEAQREAVEKSIQACWEWLKKHYFTLVENGYDFDGNPSEIANMQSRVFKSEFLAALTPEKVLGEE